MYLLEQQTDVLILSTEKYVAKNNTNSLSIKIKFYH